MTESFKGSGNHNLNINSKVEGTLFSINNIGPTNEELIGLDLEERKRKRIGLSERMDLGVDFLNTQTDSGLSKSDCTDSSDSILAKLAQQASHP